MVFWILLGILAAITIGAIIYGVADEGWLWGFANGFIGFFTGGLVLGGVFLLFLLVPSYETGRNTYELRAIATDSTTSGRFFLGTGYVSGQRTLNFVVRHEDANYVNQVYAYKSVIFENEGEPEVTYIDYGNPWIAPWRLDQKYEFVVPEGSILSDYTITNE